MGCEVQESSLGKAKHLRCTGSFAVDTRWLSPGVFNQGCSRASTPWTALKAPEAQAILQTGTVRSSGAGPGSNTF